MNVLDRIATPGDLRKLSMDELVALADECRHRILNAVADNGGHLSSNLGVVELTIALHYVYDFGPYPQGPDRLLFDVGHQSYVHKMLTGRAGAFSTLRKKNSIGGFPTPVESPYDLFAVGHAGTAISTAIGIARGDQRLNRNNHVVAMVGDASIVNGMAFEGLNHLSTLGRQLLVVLNDNGMSISPPQGALAAYLERVRVSTTYTEAKQLAQRMFGRLPGSMGNTIESVLHHVKEAIKTGIWPGQLFESMGVKYFGPVDGHDLPGLIAHLGELKEVNAPVLLHAKTVKGKGYDITSQEPTRFHSPSSFKLEGCRVEMKPPAGKSWTDAFADALIELAGEDDRVMALTAAMPDGTGLTKFQRVFPDRFLDTGICESHLVGVAAGLAKAGLRPVAAIYSTFIQRAFDQVWQEAALNGLPVVFCMDRAGFVGDDGAVHHGFMDQAFLRPMPGMVLMAPSDEAELARALRLALTLDGPSAIRYPRDVVPPTPFEDQVDLVLREAAKQPWQPGRARILCTGVDATILVYGALCREALRAALDLEEEGLSVGLVDARFCKPLDGELLRSLLRAGRPILTVEDHALQNGFGSAVLEYASAHGLPIDHVTRLGMPDRLVAHATRAQQLAEVGLDAPGIARSIRDALRGLPTARAAAVL